MRRLVTHSSLATASRLALVMLSLVAVTSTAACRTRLAGPVSAPVSAPARAVVVRGTYARDVELLRSEDFVTRARAAERLIAGGEHAVPALGAAGDGTVRALDGADVGTTAPVLRSIFADLEVDALARQLESPWPVVRRETAAELGRRGRWHAVPYLLPHLQDGDGSVRAASARALRRLTNRFFGYDAKASLRARRQATERWQEWWSVEGRVRTEQGDGDGAG